ALQCGADQVVRLVLRIHEYAQAERSTQRDAMRELALEFLGCGFAIGLVGWIQGVAERGFERGVERDHDVQRALALEQFEQEAREAMHRVDRPAFGIVQVGRDRMPRTEHVHAGIHEIGGRAAHAGCQSVSRAEGSGRGRSSCTASAVPMWMYPRTRSSAPTPSIS